MRVFVTGASGWIGSATVDELIGAGHEIVALARSDATAGSLETKGISVVRGDLDTLEVLRRGARDTEAVVHLANKHNWADPSVSNRAERAAVEAIGEALIGSDHPFVLASGAAGLAAGRSAVETDRSPFDGPDSPRGGSENLALEYVDRGVRTICARFPPTVHGMGDPQFIALVAAAARRHGVSAYIANGSNVWSAVHRADAARLIRIGLEKAPPGTLLHAVGEEAVPTRAIAEAIGQALDTPTISIAPEDAVEHFGFIGSFFAMDLPASSADTQHRFDWTPRGPTLIADIEAGAYSRAGPKP
jgi:nucleoside-diphosphate-sugar epimerase